MTRQTLYITLCFAALLNTAIAAETESPETQKTAQSVLAERCLACHGDDSRMNGLDLRSPAAALAGGKRGASINLEHPDESLLLRVIRHDAEPHMPPDEPPLPADEIALLEAWIRAIPKDLAPAEAKSSHIDLLDGLTTTQVIDRLIEAGWEEQGITPAEPCDDRTFIRRVYLDLIGQVPTVEELHAFLADTNANKREALVDRLLADPRHARHLADVFDAVLIGRSEEHLYRRRREAGWHAYLEAAFRDNRPWNELSREILLARPDEESRAAAVWFLYARRDKHQEIAEAVAPAFFGVRVECAQCHDHPVVPEIEQAHYWGLVAFFNRGKNVDSPVGPSIAESAIGGFSQFKNLEGDAKENLLTFLDASVVDEARPEGEQKESDDLYRDNGESKAPRVPKFSRREKFVDEVLADHPRVARAFVNRAWALLLGRGLVHPVDEMDSEHPPSHPQLLDHLAADFEQSGYDVRRLLRTIVLSKPYQLSPIRTAPDVHADSFAYAIEKPLIAEAYARSLAVAAGGVSESDIDKLAAELRATFPDVFPRDVVSTLPQALLLSNRPEFQSLTTVRSGSLAERMLAASDNDQRVDIAVETIFSRRPDDEERAHLIAYLNSRSDRLADGVSQLLWALLTSAEFRFNH